MAERRGVFIHAAATLAPFGAVTAAERKPLTDDPQTDLGPLAKRVLGQRLRQASHFIELATIGARLCLNKAGPTRPDMAVYFGTGLGELRKNEALFYQVFPPGAGMAAPFDFINATANMAAFYVARLAGTSARNLTVTQGLASFECALTLALDDLRAGDVATALVGAADENCFPRESYAHRWPLREEEVMGEGSAWLFLSTDASGAIAELLAVRRERQATEASALPTLIESMVGVKTLAGVVCGGQLSVNDKMELARQLPHVALRSYIELCGSFPTASGFGVARELEEAPARGHWLHINRDTDGSVMLVCWSVD